MISWFEQPTWWAYLLLVLTYYLGAWLVHRLSKQSAAILVYLSGYARRKRPMSQERQKTLRGVVGNLVTIIGFLVATLLTLRLMAVDWDTLVWMVGLFAAGFGLGARPLVSDLLTGVSFLFEDPYDVGEKVELLPDVKGVVEVVNLRTTQLQSQTGEVYIIPNGEVRTIRNFSRGRFSVADVTVKVPASSLEIVIPLLENLGREAVTLLPNLLEPWRVVSETGILGEHTELKLTAKGRFGRAAELRPNLLALVNRRLDNAGIPVHN